MNGKNKNKNERIAILIPAYNEEKYIKDVIESCFKYGFDIIVVDDGSTDGTLKTAESIIAPENLKIITIKHPVNMGKGQSLKTGFNYIINNNYSGVITIDADGQHDANEIKIFLKVIETEKPDLIIGNRMGNTKRMPFIRLATNAFTSWIISCIAREKVRDVQSGFRYINSEVLKNVKLETHNFDTEPELIIKSAWSGYSIKNIPISTIYHKDFTSSVNPFTDTIKFFKLVFNSFKWKRKFKKEPAKKFYIKEADAARKKPPQ